MLSRSLMPSLQALTAFEAVGRHGSFTKAADELALTQSAVSKQVRQLEDALGSPLFSRTGNGIILTTLGRGYLQATRRILQDLEATTHAAIASGGEESLNLAALPTFASRWLIPRLPRFLASHPGVILNLSTELKPFDLRDRPVDVAIHYGQPSWAGAHMVYLCAETIVAVASPAYLAAADLGQPGNLLRATLLQQATRPGLWQHWFDAIGLAHPHPYRGPVFDQFAMTGEAAAAGLGIALLPTFLAEQDVIQGRLARLPQAPLPGTGAYYAALPEAKRHDVLVGAFVEWLARECVA